MKTRGVLIAGNWKMNLGPNDTAKFVSDLKKAAPAGFWDKAPSPQVQACIVPPAISLVKAVEATHGTWLAVGAQNAHWEQKGAFTGELSGPMLREIGVTYVVIGHSERRQYFGETDETVRKRSESLLKQGFKVILCVGETKAEREKNLTHEVLTRQLSIGLGKGSAEGPGSYMDGRLVIAYEPVWAIGTGITATPEQAEESHHFIRQYLAENFGRPAADKTQVLYGGSVTPENVNALLACPNVDGALVGGASLKPDSFLKLVQGGLQAI